MKEHPLILKSELVRAVLEGRKTQTRCPVVPQPPSEVVELRRGVTGWYEGFNKDEWNAGYGIDCPWQVGNRLWLKEPFSIYINSLGYHGIEYEDNSIAGLSLLMPAENDKELKIINWMKDRLMKTGRNSCGDWIRKMSSIHMPRWASRITLEITDIRVERIGEISEQDASEEGLQDWYGPNAPYHTNRERFQDCWNFIYAKKGYGWSENPWVWVREFRRIKEKDE